MSRLKLQALDGFTFGYKHPISGDRTGPYPKQRLAHICPADQTFFGGAAGPGKSACIIVEAVTTCLEHANVEVAVFRRKHTELEKSLITRFRRLVPESIATFNATLKRATFANGSMLWFCHAIHESTVYDYQSAEWLALFPDEASHFTEFQLDYLWTRVRSTRPGLRKRMLMGSNPGNVGHGWLKRRYVRPPAQAVRRITHRFDGARQFWVHGDYGAGPLYPLDVWQPWPEEGDPTPVDDVPTRCFIPARLEDNPALMQADPTYRARIYALGGDKAKQLAEGDWDANEAMIVGGAWKESHMVTVQDDALLAFGYRPGQVIPWHILPDPTWRPPSTATIYGSVDYGYGAPWSFHLHAALPDGHLRTFWERYKPRKRDVEQAQMIRDDIERLVAGGMALPDWLVLDPSMWNSRAESGLAKSIAEVYVDVLGPIGVRLRAGAAGRSARLSRPNRWLDALATAPDGLPWWSVTTANPHLIRTVPEVPWDEDDPEVEDDDSENHAYEDGGRFFEARPVSPRAKAADPLAHLDPVSRAAWEGLDEDLAAHQKPRGFGATFTMP